MSGASTLRNRCLAASALFLGAFLLFLKTHAPSPYLDDSGETITVCRLLGIGHPPGYPFHTLLGRVWNLLPLGGAADLTDLFSSFLAALAASGLGLLALAGFGSGTGRAVLAACLSGLLLALGPSFWFQALVAKGSIYMLDLALSLAMLGCLWNPDQARAARLFWLLLGLALAHHYMTQLVLLPTYGALAVAAPGAPSRRARGLGKFFQSSWLLLPGLSLYLYLPLRAALQPAVNWGDIHSLGGFLFFLLREQYSAGEISRGLGTSVSQGLAISGYLIREGGWLGFPLAAWGLVHLWKGRHPARLALTLGLLGPCLACALYFNLAPSRYAILRANILPAFVFQAWLAGWGAWSLLELTRPGRAGLALAAAALAVPLAWRAARLYPGLDLSRYFYAQDSARNLLLSAPPGAALFASGDSIIFPLWYLQDVERERPDVALVGTPVLPMRWVRLALLRRHPSLLQPTVVGEIGAESIPRLVHDMLVMNQGRLPLFMTYNKRGPELAGFSLVPHGMLYRPVPVSAAAQAGPGPAALQDLFRAYNLRGLYRPDVDPETRRLIIGDFAIHHNSFGLYLEDRKDYPGAFGQYRQACGLDPGNPEFPFNAGNALYEQGRYREAVAWYQRSLSVDPAYENAWYNLGVADLALGSREDARQAFSKVLSLDPGRRDVRAFLGQNP